MVLKALFLCVALFSICHAIKIKKRRKSRELWWEAEAPPVLSGRPRNIFLKKRESPSQSSSSKMSPSRKSSKVFASEKWHQSSERSESQDPRSNGGVPNNNRYRYPPHYKRRKPIPRHTPPVRPTPTRPTPTNRPTPTRPTRAPFPRSLPTNRPRPTRNPSPRTRAPTFIPSSLEPTPSFTFPPTGTFEPSPFATFDPSPFATFAPSPLITFEPSPDVSVNPSTLAPSSTTLSPTPDETLNPSTLAPTRTPSPTTTPDPTEEPTTTTSPTITQNPTSTKQPSLTPSLRATDNAAATDSHVQQFQDFRPRNLNIASAQNELHNIIIFGDHHSIDFTSTSVCGTNPINVVLWREIADFPSSNSRDRVLVDISRSLENNIRTHSLVSFAMGLVSILPRSIGAIRDSGTLEDPRVLDNIKTLVIPFAHGSSYTKEERENIHRLLLRRGGRLIFVTASDDTEFGIGRGLFQINGLLAELIGTETLRFATRETVHMDTSIAMTAGKVQASPINQVEGGEYCLGGGKALVVGPTDNIIAEYHTGETAITS